MAYLKQMSNGNYCVTRKTGCVPKNTHSKSTERNWWLIKWNGDTNSGKIIIRSITFPKALVGKKIRMIIEVIKEENNMTQAKCFKCEKVMEGVGKPMEELIKDKFPIFCCEECADKFPDNGTKEFEERLKELSK